MGLGVGESIALAVGVPALIWLVAHAIIDVYFRRKEQLINRLIEKQKGTRNGS